MLSVRVQNVQCVVLVSWFYVRRSRTTTDQASKQQTPTYLRQRESHLGVNLWDYNTLRCVRLRGMWPDLQYELAFFLFLVHFNSWAFASSEISSTVTLHYTALLQVALDIVPSRFSLQIYTNSNKIYVSFNLFKYKQLIVIIVPKKNRWFSLLFKLALYFNCINLLWLDPC